MDPFKTAQDLLRCSLCEKTVPPYCCNLCHVTLCKECAGKHLLDETKDHRVLSIKHRWSNDNHECSKHSTRQYELFCEQCDLPICVQCASTDEHKGHEFGDLLRNLERKKKELQREKQELESVLSVFEAANQNIKLSKEKLRKVTGILQRELKKQGEIWHMAIDTIINKIRSEINDVESEQLVVLSKHESKINIKLVEIEQNIQKLKLLDEASDVFAVSKYKYGEVDFPKSLPTLSVTLPKFSPKEIDALKIEKLFGSLSKPTMMLEEILRNQETAL